MQQIPQSQHLSGQCPNCGWTPPLQNAFRPNIMNEYLDKDGRMVILSETDDEVKSPAGLFIRNRDDNGRKIRRDIPATAVHQSQGQQTFAGVSTPSIAAPTSVLPSKDIPAGLMKTPEEVAATPKDKVTPAPVVLPTPTMSNTAAPAQTANTQTDIKQP